MGPIPKVHGRNKDNREEQPNIRLGRPPLEGIPVLGRSSEPRTPRGNPNVIGHVNNIVASIKAPTIEETKLTKYTYEKRESVDIPKTFDNLTSTARTMALAQRSAPGRLLTECCALRAQTNILRAIQGALRSAASGINWYLRFCQSMGAPAFPITQATVSRRREASNPGKTYELYVNHIRKADVMLGGESAWRNSEIRTIAGRLTNAQDRSSALPNFARHNDIFRILERENNRSALARVAYVAYLLPLRVHSATLQLRRASADEPIRKFLPQEPKATIGVNTFEKVQVLSIKSKYRKNIRTFAGDAY